MKRIIFSLILGIILPIILLVTIGTISEMLPESALTRIYIAGIPSPGLLTIPVLLPAYFCIYTKGNFILPEIFDTFLFRVLSVVLFDWILYGLLSYWLLGKLKWFKRQSVKFSDEPPLPPSFQD